MDNPLRSNLQDHGIQHHLYLGILYHIHKFLSVFRSSQFFFEIMQSKTVMDTLIQNPAGFLVPF